jgi:cytochrome c oxidase subunit IV
MKYISDLFELSGSKCWSLIGIFKNLKKKLIIFFYCKDFLFENIYQMFIYCIYVIIINNRSTTKKKLKIPKTQNSPI